MPIICQYLKYFLLFSLIITLGLPYFFILAEETTSTFEGSTSTQEIVSTENEDPSSLIEERKALEEELKKLEEEILKYEQDITKTKQEKKTLQNQIYILRKKIKKLNLQIQESNIMIEDIGFQIKDTEASINQTSSKIDQFRFYLVNILRQIYEQDQKSLVEILLSEKTLSGFFNNLMDLESLNLNSQKLLTQIENLKSYLENQKMALDEEKTDLERVLKIQVLQKQKSQGIKKNQEYFLKLTEAQYQKYLREKEEKEREAAQIRARIFELIGVPEAPTFGEALDIAKYVERLTGVRPAFLLAVMTQESNIGKNVGQCFLTDSQTGQGVRVKTKEKVLKVMKPDRDIPHFQDICQQLGRDPFNTLVSCPMEYGWGGAMGPAQFIPSTWIRYEERVKEITGKPADPWDIKDAFLAAALYLADYGAAYQTRNSEWKAAMIYFSGTTNKKYRFYGNSVLNIAQKYEQDIESIEKGSLTQRTLNIPSVFSDLSLEKRNYWF